LHLDFGTLYLKVTFVFFVPKVHASQKKWWKRLMPLLFFLVPRKKEKVPYHQYHKIYGAQRRISLLIRQIGEFLIIKIQGLLLEDGWQV
jgi:hypothetical protein